MRTRLVATVILLLVFCFTLSGCGGDTDAPLGNVEVPSQSAASTVRIYVCGAVEREGYYDVEIGVDYYEVFRLAGILPQSAFPTLSSSYVDGSVTAISVGYYEDDTRHDCSNANSPYIVARMKVDGLSEDIVNKLADYIDAHGKIANKQQLREALGDDYDGNYYKLFIAEKDYEEVD